MNLFNKQYIKCVKYLTSHKKFIITSKNIQLLLDISPQNAYQIIRTLNSNLVKNGLKEVSLGRYLSNEQYLFLCSHLTNIEQNIFFDLKERRLLIDLIITLSPKRWTINDFEDLFLMSRNTILRDIAFLKKRPNFTPFFSNKKGFFYYEKNLYEIFLHVQDISHQIERLGARYINFILDLFDIEMNYGVLLDKAVLLKKKYFDVLDKRISIHDALVIRLFIELISSIENLQDDKYLNFFGPEDIIKFQKTKENVIIRDSISCNFKHEISEYLTNFLTLQLLSLNKEADEHFDSANFYELLILSKQIVKEWFIQNEIEPTYDDLNKIIKHVQVQLKPFWYAQKYKSVDTYDYLYVDKNSERTIKDILLKPGIHENYIKLFPDGFSDEQITILSMIFFEMHVKIDETKRELNILLITSLPIYSHDIIKNVISSIPFPINLKEKRVSDYADIEKITESYDLVITELENISTDAAVFLIKTELTDKFFKRLKLAIYESYKKIFYMN